MATLLIAPISTLTVGGYKAEIRGVNNDSTDCLHGVLWGSDGTEYTVNWDLYGRARDNSDKCNLDMRQDEHFALRSLAIPLLSEHAKEYYSDLNY
ncbi:hypothetical protein [Serratia nevei]|uniref:hypothetical protein n=1 Tax=Serratia nevei TaxID=2703794 RepID=UPI0033158044